MDKSLPQFKDGDELRDFLPSARIGSYLYYRNILHRVIDAGVEQGHRVVAIKGAKENMKMDLIIDIDCYQCGTNISIPFRFGVQQAEYSYCNECQEGVEITSRENTLSIIRLQQE